MARVTLQIGGLSHEIACRDGGEEQLRRAGALVDEHWQAARPVAGDSAARTMLLAALTLADALIELRSAPPPAAPDQADLSRVADRLEALARSLETDAASA